MNSHTFVAIFCFVLVIPVCSPGVTIPEDVQIITEEYPPMNYMENGTLQGISVDLVEDIFHRLGSDINRSSFQVLPWHEGYNETLHTKNTMLFSTSRLPEREELFLWAGPVALDKKALFMLKGTELPDTISISTLRIATVKDDSGEGCALVAGANPDTIIRCNSTKEAIKLVEQGSADAFAYNILAGQEAVEKYATDPSRFVTGMDIGEIDNYIAFNPDTSPEFVEAVNDTIREIQLERSSTGFSVYEDIVARYLPVQ